MQQKKFEFLNFNPKQVFGRNIATDRIVKGAYISEFTEKIEIEKIQKRIQVYLRYFLF